MFLRFLVLLILITVLGGCVSTEGMYHPVRQGETLYRISRTYNVGEVYLARINGIDDPTELRVGTKLFIPGAKKLKTVPQLAKRSAAPARKSTRENKPSKVRAPEKSSSKKLSHAPASKPKARVAAKPAPAPELKKPPTKKGQFQLPVAGKIVRKFGESSGKVNKGIEISAPRGTPVVSSAAGQVIYSGNGIAAYGNLIILKHDNSFYTVYGFNQKNLVEAGSFVGKGQRIALLGTPPRGGSPRLHFEIRYGKKAVNPIFYLP